MTLTAIKDECLFCSFFHCEDCEEIKTKGECCCGGFSPLDLEGVEL
jgi:hypothetical protein